MNIDSTIKEIDAKLERIERAIAHQKGILLLREDAHQAALSAARTGISSTPWTTRPSDTKIGKKYYPMRNHLRALEREKDFLMKSKNLIEHDYTVVSESRKVTTSNVDVWTFSRPPRYDYMTHRSDKYWIRSPVCPKIWEEGSVWLKTHPWRKLFQNTKFEERRDLLPATIYQEKADKYYLVFKSSVYSYTRTREGASILDDIINKKVRVRMDEAWKEIE